MISTAAIKAFIQGSQFKDPRLYEVLMAIVDRLDLQAVDIQAISAEIATTIREVIGQVDPVTNFTVLVFPDYIKLVWSPPGLPAPNSSVINYEIREGLVWETAVRLLITNTFQAVLDPPSIGTHRYQIKSIDVNGFYTAIPAVIDLIVPTPGASNIISSVIDNNVLLYWTSPISYFRITHYVIRREGTIIGYKDGTFTSVFEQASGTYTYSIQAVDVAGNLGLESFIDVSVAQPPDYVLEDLYESQLDGTLNNCILEIDKLIFNVANETFQAHFDSRGWNNIQDQIDDGFPIYIQPTPDVGTYEEMIDYGTIINAVLVNITYAYEVSAGSGHDIEIEMATSTDNITYSGWVAGTSQFLTNFRYLKFRITATALD